MVTSQYTGYPWRATIQHVLLVGGAGVVFIVAGLFSQIPVIWLTGIVLILFVIATLPRHVRIKRLLIEEPPPEEKGSAPRPISAVASPDVAEEGKVGGLVDQMLAQHRYALLLRPQIATNLIFPL